MDGLIDAAELTTWLTHLTQSVDRSLREPVRAQAAAMLREGLDARDKVGVPVLIQLAFLADCLRVAHLAIDADGRVETDELARVVDLVGVAASKYFFALPAYEAFDDGAASSDDAARFLAVHRDDPGPFGFRRSAEWRGLALAQLVERSTRNAAPLHDHERMLVRVMEAVFAGRTTEVEHAVRRQLRDLFEQPGAAAAVADPRAVAFCRSDGPEVFSAVSHGSHFHERDPFDVEAIHADARWIFHQQVERAATPEQAKRDHGRMLLILGESGAGKTHLLRALRGQVHGRRLGYVGYLQLNMQVEDYARFVLQRLIDSLELPYDAPSLSESGLMYLSDGLVESRDAISPDDLERLRTADLAPPQLEQLVGSLVDAVLRSDGLERLEADLVQALLLLQRRDPALQRRIVRFLRCEALNHHERGLLGGLAPRDQAHDPLRTIQQLATLMHELQLAALVVVVDQVEEVVPDGQSVARLQQALDAIRAIADAVSSSVVVVSCLQDVYDAVRPRLSQSLRDRLERDEVRLESYRQADEIEQMLARRLEHLYGFFDVAWRDDDPLYPFAPAQLDAIVRSRLRTRDCLGKFRAFHAACIAARSLVPVAATGAEPLAAPPAADAPRADEPRAKAADPAPIRDPALDRRWQELLAGVGGLPEGDADVLALVADAVRGGAEERGLAIDVRAAPSIVVAGVILEGAALPRRLVAVCNNPPQRSSFGAQLINLRGLAAQAHAVPVALRNGGFKFQPKSKMAQYIGEHIAAGGLAVPLVESHLRVAVAARMMAAANPAGFAAWRQVAHPLSDLPFVRQLLELDREAAPVIAVAAPSAPRPSSSAPPAVAPVVSRPARGSTPQVDSGAAGTVRLGVVDSMRADPIFLPLEDIKTHVAFLGSTGSGKTTAALSVVEQLLERDVSVLLVDRKGDLARYVSDAWWEDPSVAPAARDRKRALRQRIELALFTPGNVHGRPLKLPLVPALADIKPQDREQLARYAAEGLATMMGYGKSAAHKAKTSVLQCAILLHGNEREITLDLLLDTINRPDPDLLHLVGALQRHFAGLSEDLQTLRIQRGSLLAGAGESLDLDALLPPPGTRRARLSIINTSALTEVPVLQFWVSRLLVELSRLGRKRPSPTLQAAAFFDEADAYVPATSTPPTKEPMFDLLRRSRSTGIGVLLATQNPGDFDYKARDNISTWLLGKISQSTAIDKMKNLFASYPDVGPRLASQRTGSFFLLTATTKRELKADRSLMETVQLPENEVAELAKQTRAPDRH